MKRVFIGVDPGASGAIAVIDDIGAFKSVDDWPGSEQEAARVLREICAIYDRDDIPIYAAIEKVSSMPKQGVSSVFKFGSNYGIWRGLLAAFEIPFILVPPRTWQKGLVTKDDRMMGKARGNCAAAARLFPDAPLYGPKGGPKDGRADALMIADWRRRH